MVESSEEAQYRTMPAGLDLAKSEEVVSVVCHHEGRGYQSDEVTVVLQVNVGRMTSIYYANELFKQYLGRNSFWLQDAGNRRNGKPAHLPDSASTDTAVRMQLACPCGVQVPVSSGSPLWQKLADADQWIVELRALPALLARLKRGE